MQFHFAEPQTQIEELAGGNFYIHAVGRINPADDIAFEDFLKATNAPPRCTVYIDSIGGDVEAAIGIGRLIRGAWLSTDVGRYEFSGGGKAEPYIRSRKKLGGRCLIAATLMYLGGRLRYLDDEARFGVHQFKFQASGEPDAAEVQVAKAQNLSARISAYVVEMGISSEFLVLSASVPGSEMLYVSRSDLERIGVVTGGQTKVTWTLEANSGLSYVKGDRDSLFGHHKVMLGYRRGHGFLFWAVIETQGRSRELLNFPVVEIVINGEDMRIDVGARCERFENGVYTNFFARVSEEEARAMAHS